MKRLLWALLFNIIIVFSIFGFTVDVDKIPGLYFDSQYSKYIPLYLKIYVDNQGLIYINIPKDAYASYFLEGNEYEQFKSFIEKGIQWGQKAREYKVPLNRELGRLTKKVTLGKDKKELALHLIVYVTSSIFVESPKQELVIDIRGFRNSMSRSIININVLDSNKLLTALEKAKVLSDKYLEKHKEIKQTFN